MNPFENFEVVTYDGNKLMRFIWRTRIHSSSEKEASEARRRKEQLFKRILSALIGADDIDITSSSVEEVTFTAIVETGDREENQSSLESVD